jgi:predicted SnoaL-like aldol condensation-catalyzing enzyme
MGLLDNKHLAQKAASIWTSKAFDELVEIFDANCIHHQQSQQHNVTFSGLQNWRTYIEAFLKKYPDYQETLISQIAESDKVVNLVEGGTSIISWTGVTINRIQNGKVQETWAWFKRKEES